MKRLFNTIYLLPRGFRQRKVTYSFYPNEYGKYEDFIQHTYIKLFWRVYRLVRTTLYYDTNRSSLPYVNKFKVR